MRDLAVPTAAPTGRDSIAQGALALGRVADKNVKPQRGEIPVLGSGIALRRIRSGAVAAASEIHPETTTGD